MYIIFLGVGIVIVGLLFVVTSWNSHDKLETDIIVYMAIKKVLGREPAVVKNPSFTRRVLIYTWHYTGYLLIAMGASIIGAYVIHSIK